MRAVRGQDGKEHDDSAEPCGICVLDSCHEVVSERLWQTQSLSAVVLGDLECASGRVAGPQASWSRVHSGTSCVVKQDGG